MTSGPRGPTELKELLREMYEQPFYRAGDKDYEVWLDRVAAWLLPRLGPRMVTRTSESERVTELASSGRRPASDASAPAVPRGGTSPPLDLRAIEAKLQMLQRLAPGFGVPFSEDTAALLAHGRALRAALTALVEWQAAALETESALEALEQIIARAAAVLAQATDGAPQG